MEMTEFRQEGHCNWLLQRSGKMGQNSSSIVQIHTGQLVVDIYADLR